MEIEVITTSAMSSSLDSTRVFGIILNKATSTIKMLHWYVCDHNAHEILGDLYDDLTDLFDKLQEEVIGTSKEYSVIFPSFNISAIQLEHIEMYQDNKVIIDYYYGVVNTIKDMITSLEFDNYVTSVKSGINNTKEDIISRINKANYLMSMINF
jgi:hypothetical protein